MNGTAIFIYEPEQLSALDLFLRRHRDNGGSPRVVSFDAEVDYALQKKGIPYASGKNFQDRTSTLAYECADAVTRAVCENPRLSFLEYRGVPLLQPFRLSLHIYFFFLMKHMDTLMRFLEEEPGITRIIVPPSTALIPKTSGALAAYDAAIIVEATRRVAASRGLAFESPQAAPRSQRFANWSYDLLFAAKRAAFGLFLQLLNRAVSLRPRRSVRILASDYWRNLAPLMRELPEAELVLLDRTEALNAGWSNIWRNRVTFVHVRHFMTRRGRRAALAEAAKHIRAWESIRPEVWAAADLSFRGASLRELCEEVVDFLVRRAMLQAMCDIEGTYAMYANTKPDAVLLRASISGQTHFAILPLVAKQLGIPSLEPQHGIQYVGPGSPTIHHAAEYYATYGPLVCAELEALGYQKEKLLAVGSPRFDAYSRLSQHEVPHDGIVFLSAAPPISSGEGFGTFSIEEYFAALGRAVRGVPGGHLVVSSRSGTYRRTFAEEAEKRGLADVSYKSVAGVSLPTLFAEADVVIASYSTVVYEAMMHRKPVVIVAFAPIERLMAGFHFSRFEKAGALRIARSPKELSGILRRLAESPEVREHMSTVAEAFMKENFSFDGNASQRIAERIRTWARGTQQHAAN